MPSRMSRVRSRATAVGEQAAFVPRRERRLALHAKPFEGVGEEGVFGGLTVFLGALAVEAPRIDAPRAEPALALEALEPVLDEHGLAHAAPGDERDDGDVRLGEGEVEQRKFLFATNEFFFAQAGAAGEREFVEVGFGFGSRNVECGIRSTDCGKLGKGTGAKFYRDFSSKLAESMVAICFRQRRKWNRRGLFTRFDLQRSQPEICFPIALLAQNRRDNQALLVVTALQFRQLMLENKRRLQELIGQQQHSEPCASHRCVDAGVPVVAELRFVIVPHVENVMLLKHGQLCQQAIFPIQSVSTMAIADEDARLI